MEPGDPVAGGYGAAGRARLDHWREVAVDGREKWVLRESDEWGSQYLVIF